jgi:hypothetical protein
VSAETITRPNGKPYRRRKPTQIATFDHGDSMAEGVVVIGTHDVDLATRLAADRLAYFDLDPASARTSWWRLVPWDAFGIGCDQSWITDEVRGAPVVVWTPEAQP